MAKKWDARALSVLALVMAGALSGCVNFSALDDLDTAPLPTDPFQQALYKNFAFLARSFGQIGQAQYGAFDQTASLSLAKTDGSIADLANAYADKAMKLSRDELVEPEPSLDIKTHEMRDRLVRALFIGREAFPRDAARAQADWDCWRLNSTVASQAASAETCHKSFNVTLPRLEAEVAPVAAARAKEVAEKQKANGGKPVAEMDD